MRNPKSQSLQYGVGLALVGCGDIASTYLNAALDVPEANFVVLHDTADEVANKLGDEYRIAVADDYQSVLDSDDVDAVLLAVPHHLHASMTIAAAHAGKHVLCEKPIATTVADAERMIAACSEAGVRLCIGYAMRFLDRAIEARRIVNDGLIGDPILADIRFLVDKPASYWVGGWSGRSATTWRAKIATAGGGVLLMNVSHDLDLAQWITRRRIAELNGVVGTYMTDVEVEDTAVAVGTFEEGGLVSVAAGSAVPGGADVGVRIVGKEGQILLSSNLDVYTNAAGSWERAVEVTDTAAAHAAAYERFLRSFVRSVALDEPTPVSAEDALHTLRLILGIYGRE